MNCLGASLPVPHVDKLDLCSKRTDYFVAMLLVKAKGLITSKEFHLDDHFTLKQYCKF